MKFTLTLLVTVVAMFAPLPAAHAADPGKVLRVSLGDVTSLDPQQAPTSARRG